MSSVNLPSLRDDGKVYITLESRHLLFILNTKFDLSGFVKKALDDEIDYFEWATSTKAEAKELETKRKECRQIDYDIHEAVEHISTLFNRRAELHDDICIMTSNNTKDLFIRDSTWRGKIEPINSREGDNVFHHMHLDLGSDVDKKIGIYIPSELHRSIHHNSTTGKGMREINKAALEWLCEQSVI